MNIFHPWGFSVIHVHARLKGSNNKYSYGMVFSLNADLQIEVCTAVCNILSSFFFLFGESALQFPTCGYYSIFSINLELKTFDDFCFWMESKFRRFSNGNTMDCRSYLHSSESGKFY